MSFLIKYMGTMEGGRSGSGSTEPILSRETRIKNAEYYYRELLVRVPDLTTEVLPEWFIKEGYTINKKGSLVKNSEH